MTKSTLIYGFFSKKQCSVIVGKVLFNTLSIIFYILKYFWELHIYSIINDFKYPERLESTFRDILLLNDEKNKHVITI